MRGRTLLVGVVVYCLPLFSLSCGDDPQLTITRVRLLQSKKKYAEAVSTAMSGADRCEGKARGELLLLAAENIYQIYKMDNRRGHLTQMLTFVQTVINEGLAEGARPYYLAHLAFASDGQYRKAADILGSGEQAAKDMMEAGQFRSYLISILAQHEDWGRVIPECDIFLKKYPSHPLLPNVQYQKETADAKLTERAKIMMSR